MKSSLTLCKAVQSDIGLSGHKTKKMINSETLKFLKTLEKNNSKEWFDQNRKTYDQAKANYLDFVGEVLGRMKKIDSSLANP